MATPYQMPPTEQQVTASALVRQFGHWQDRAARAPVYVLHHGRPRLVLTSVDLLDALCRPRGNEATTSSLSALLDALPQMLIVLSADGRIEIANAAARARFGASVETDRPAHDIARRGDPYLPTAIARVLATGTAETLHFESARFPDRLIEATFTPLPNGCLIMLHDATAREEQVSTRARLDAVLAAIGASGSGAIVSIGMRGQILAAGNDLSQLTGIAPDRLTRTRAVTLFTPATRAVVGDAIERAMAGDDVSTVAELLVAGAQMVAVDVGMAPVREAGLCTGAIAAITRRGAK